MYSFNSEHKCISSLPKKGEDWIESWMRASLEAEVFKSTTKHWHHIDPSEGHSETNGGVYSPERLPVCPGPEMQMPL